ncbi:MAG: tetratricopeptide repeat protein [Crocinitomicaceae bacterium]|nr:tetratricopeptide repeat protein [Crocinitomicaceae bacterium]
MFSNNTHKLADEALKAGEIDKSIQLFSQALKESPNDCNILSDRGVAYLHANKKDKSLADFNKAIDLQPNYGFRYAARAFAKNNFGDIDGAIADYEKAVQLDPEDSVGHNNLGLLLEQKGYQKEAEDRFKRADSLSEMEDGLLDVIDNLEEGASPHIEFEKKKNIVEMPKIVPLENQMDMTKEEDSSSTSEELKKVFTSKKQFGEFIKFIKNGFKIK